jgi:hypothetical protein
MHPLYKILDSTVMGRLRSRIAIEWSKSDEIFPSERTVLSNIMKLWRNNPHSARLYFNAFYTPPLERCDMSCHLSRQEVNKLLEKLAAKPPVHRIHGEGVIEVGSNEVWACLVMGHVQPSGAPGYYAFVLQDDCFESENFTHVSIVPPFNSAPCIMGFQTSNGWNEVAPRHVNKCSSLRAALLLLKHEFEYAPNPWSHELKSSSHLPSPPEDAEYMRLIDLVIKRRLMVTHATLPMQDIEPHDFSHLKHISEIEKLPEADEGRMVVYWRNGKFMMSDDYLDYCRHVQKGSVQVKVAILGEFPKDKAEIERVGERTILPPPVIVRAKPIPLIKDEQDTKWLAHNKLKTKSLKSVDPDMMATWLMFAQLVADLDANERQLHEFIFKKPVIISEFGDDVISEVSLGNKYFVDLLVHRNGLMPRVYLIELERANHRILTQGGQETKEVTHAVQQVSDWLRWWRNNSADPLVKPSGGLEPRGVVVIGRSSLLSEENRQKLAHNNQNRDVEVITYDELLDKFGHFILSQVSNEPSLG